MFSKAWKRLSVEMGGIEVEARSVEEEEAGGVEGWCLVGDEWGRLGKVETNNQSSDLLTC
jgi:hypothetical protein